jgi:SIR2-like domain
MTPKLPGMLVRYIQQKRCVVFAGAGLSAGAGLPTWKGLLLKGIEELAGALPEGELHQEELRRLVDHGKLLEVADFCKEKLGGAYHQLLAEQVRGDQAELPRTHDVLMQLPFSAWVTTNYDKLLERAFSKVKGGFPKTLTHKDTEALGRLLFDDGPFILKAHGDIDRPETVVLTSRDYSEIIHGNPAFNEIFSGLLLTKALFFVGYSLSDPDFRLLMDRQLSHFKGFVPDRYALMTGVGPVERDVLWRTARIQVISYENKSGKHAEVLQFLEALKAAVLPKPVPEVAPEAVQVKASAPIPAPAAPLPGTIRPQNAPGPSRQPVNKWVLEAFSAPAPEPAAAPPGVKPPAADPFPDPDEFLFGPDEPLSASGRPAGVSGLEQEDALLSGEEIVVSGADDPLGAAGDDELGVAAAGEGTLDLPDSAHQLFIEQVEGRVQLRLIRGGTEPVVQGAMATSLNEDVWQSLQRSTMSNARLYSHLMDLFRGHLPHEVLEVLGTQGSSARAPLVLHVAPEVTRFPWELLPQQGEPVCLKRRVVRAPVGVPAQVRGTPSIRARPRILFIEGQSSARGGGTHELERLAALYPARDFVCTVLQGEHATFERVMAELLAGADEELPDLVHYSGDVGRMGMELYLKLPGLMALSAGALRSVLNRGRLPFLVMNAPSSAFAPYGFGAYPAEEGYQRLPAPTARSAIFEGREGFMEQAIRLGVGAFVGAFARPDPQAGTVFMAALHRSLATGLPIADAVLQARKETHRRFPDDPTALQYVLGGDGDLLLWDSRREDTQD